MPGPAFGDRFTVMAGDAGDIELHCVRCQLLGADASDTCWAVGYHPSLDVVIGAAAAHNTTRHDPAILDQIRALCETAALSAEPATALLARDLLKILAGPDPPGTDGEAPVPVVLSGTWYLATCTACAPPLPQPFRDQSGRDTWADDHAAATGHDVERVDIGTIGGPPPDWTAGARAEFTGPGLDAAQLGHNLQAFRDQAAAGHWPDGQPCTAHSLYGCLACGAEAGP